MIGLDIGQRCIRLVALERRFGRWRLQACLFEPLAQADPTVCVAALRSMIAGLPARLRRGTPAIAMAMPLCEVTLTTRVLPAGASDADAGFMAAMEAEQQAAPAAVDYRVVPCSLAQAQAASGLMLLLCPQACVDERAAWLDAAGCRLASLTVDALALADCYVAGTDLAADVLLIDVGGSALRLTAFQGALPVYWRRHVLVQDSTPVTTVLARALQHYRMARLSALPDAVGKVLLCGGGAAQADVQHTIHALTGCNPEPIDPFACLRLSPPTGLCAPAFAQVFALASQVWL